MTGLPPEDRPDRGFLLLEAAVAMAIIMIVMTAVTSFFVVTVRINREQQNAQVAAQVAGSGMALVYSVRGSAVITGRDAASSTAQWNALTSGVTPYLSGTVEAWDAAAATGSGPTATLPTTPQDTTVRGVTFHVSWYIGSCWQPAAGGTCAQTVTAGAVPMYRIVVAVTWTEAGCASSLCTYAHSVLISNANTDPVFNPGGGPVASSTPTGALGGSPQTFPGKLEAEAYDFGGQGVGYSVTSVNGGLGYRNDAVDIEPTSDSSGIDDLSWTSAGQWQKYTVNATYAGSYIVSFRVADPSAITDAFHLADSSGTNLSGNINLPGTGSYSTWGTVTATFTLPAGVQTLTLAQDKAGWNLNYMLFGPATPIPGTVEAENYDFGGQGSAYNLSNPVASPDYRFDGQDIGTTGDASGYTIGWTGGGQWMHFTVKVASSGAYSVTFRVAGPYSITDAFHLASSGGTNLSGNINLPGTADWNTWSTVTATVILPAGIQTLTLAQDNGGWNLNYMTFTATNGPYGGTAATVPGTLQAENYDTGGQGLAYNVGTVNGSGYRTDSVDLETTSDTGGGYDLGWTAAGQWQKYTVNLAVPGTFSVAFRVAGSGAVTDAFHLAGSSGTNLSGNVNLPGTGGAQTWGTVTASVYLPAGQQVLTLAQDHAGWNLNYLTFTTVEGPYGGTAPAAPGTVQAENYDTGGQGLGYSVTAVNGSGYRADSVDIGTTGDASGYTIGWTGGSQWMRYTVNVATARTYTVTIRYAAPSTVTDAFHLTNSVGTNLSGNINLPGTADWNTWAQTTATVLLPAGTQTLTLRQDNGGWNLNYLTFS
jgi:type II secretory pathway pseudopilin PulG